MYRARPDDGRGKNRWRSLCFPWPKRAGMRSIPGRIGQGSNQNAGCRRDFRVDGEQHREPLGDQLTIPAEDGAGRCQPLFPGSKHSIMEKLLISPLSI